MVRKGRCCIADSLTVRACVNGMFHALNVPPIIHLHHPSSMRILQPQSFHVPLQYLYHDTSTLTLASCHESRPPSRDFYSIFFSALVLPCIVLNNWQAKLSEFPYAPSQYQRIHDSKLGASPVINSSTAIDLRCKG